MLDIESSALIDLLINEHSADHPGLKVYESSRCRQPERFYVCDRS